MIVLPQVTFVVSGSATTTEAHARATHNASATARRRNMIHRGFRIARGVRLRARRVSLTGARLCASMSPRPRLKSDRVKRARHSAPTWFLKKSSPAEATPSRAACCAARTDDAEPSVAQPDAALGERGAVSRRRVRAVPGTRRAFPRRPFLDFVRSPLSFLPVYSHLHTGSGEAACSRAARRVCSLRG